MEQTFLGAKSILQAMSLYVLAGFLLFLVICLGDTNDTKGGL